MKLLLSGGKKYHKEVDKKETAIKKKMNKM